MKVEIWVCTNTYGSLVDTSTHWLLGRSLACGTHVITALPLMISRALHASRINILKILDAEKDRKLRLIMMTY